MSSTLLPNNVDIPITKETMENKKDDNLVPSSLPAKFFKSLTFGYWMTLKMKNDGIIDETTFNNIIKDYLKVYDSVPAQLSYYESFDTDFKMISKDIKKLIKDFHKPPKVKKEKKLKIANNPQDKPKKRGRPCKKDLSNQNDNDDLISRIVTAAIDNIDNSEPRIYNRVSKTATNITSNKDTEVVESKKDTEVLDICIGCKSGADTHDAHINPNSGFHWINCSCSDTELTLFTFTKDNFKCLLHKPSLTLLDIHTQNPLNSHTHSLSRISLPNSTHMLLDHNHHAYPL